MKYVLKYQIESGKIVHYLNYETDDDNLSIQKLVAQFVVDNDPYFWKLFVWSGEEEEDIQYDETLYMGVFTEFDRIYMNRFFENNKGDKYEKIEIQRNGEWTTLVEKDQDALDSHPQSLLSSNDETDWRLLQVEKKIVAVK
jgi:hypothetical protein